LIIEKMENNKPIPLTDVRLSDEQWQRYLSGNLPDAEKEQIKLFIARNPPEQEALAGFESVGNDIVLTDDVSELKKRIHQRVRESGLVAVKPLPVWKFNPLNISIAASVSVLVMTAAIMFMLKNVREPQAVLPKPMPSEQNSDTSGGILSENKSKVSPEDIPAIQTQPTQKQIVKADKKPVRLSPPDTPDQPADILARTDSPTATASQEQENTLQEKVSPDSEVSDGADPKVSEKDKERAYRAEARKKSQTERAVKVSPAPFFSDTRTVRGSVRDVEGNLLPGVSVLIAGSTNGTVTDATGSFSLPEVRTKDRLSFNFIGFSSLQVPVNQKDSLTVVLQPDIQALNEVVVVGYGNNDADIQNETALHLSEPAGGWSSYKEYVSQELHYPETARVKKIQGVVTVSFFVEPDSRLTELRVRKSLGYGCDEEALRLVQTGPRWNPAYDRKEQKPVRQKVRLRIRFRL
jgi:TonB family protein